MSKQQINTIISSRLGIKSLIFGILLGVVGLSTWMWLYFSAEQEDAVSGASQVYFLEPMEIRWADDVVLNPYREKRMEWEKELLQLRSLKVERTEAGARAERMISLYLQAEDLSQRLETVKNMDPAKALRIRQSLIRLDTEASAVENLTE